MRVPRFARAASRALPRAAGAMLAVGALIGIPWAFYHPPAGVPVTLPLGPRPAVTVTESPTPSLRPAAHPAPSQTNGASLSPVLALRFSPGGVTGTGGSGTASAGSTGGSGSGGGGPQPSHAPTPAPSPSTPKPSPTPRRPPPGCTVHANALGLAMCASVQIGVVGG